MCKSTSLLKLELFVLYFHSLYLCPQQTAQLNLCQLQASKHPLIYCSDSKSKVKFSLYTHVKLHSFLFSALHSNESSHSHPGHSIQSEYPRYLCQCDAEQRTDLINCWFVTDIFYLFCLSFTIKPKVIRT